MTGGCAKAWQVAVERYRLGIMRPHPYFSFRFFASSRLLFSLPFSIVKSFTFQIYDDFSHPFKVLFHSHTSTDLPKLSSQPSHTHTLSTVAVHFHFHQSRLKHSSMGVTLHFLSYVFTPPIRNSIQEEASLTSSPPSPFLTAFPASPVVVPAFGAYL